MDNSKIRIAFGEEFKKIRKKFFPQYNQTRFADIINEHLDLSWDFSLDQKKVSQIELGRSIQVPEIFIDKFCRYCSEVLKYEVNPSIVDEYININREINSHFSKQIIKVSEYEHLICKSSDKIFSQYFGTYNCLFYSTDSLNRKPIKGILTIKSDTSTNQCKAEFQILDDKNIIKEYEGVFMFNTHYSMWYCILVGKLKQEVCMLVAQHFKSTLKDNLFNIAFAITSSAGMKKRPTVHRMFISRKKIDIDKIDLLLAQLKLNDDTIFISEDNILALEQSIKKELENSCDDTQKYRLGIVAECIERIKHCKCEKYYRIDESELYDTHTICDDKVILGYAVSKIRQCTENKYYNKLSDTVHEICSEIMESEFKD